jgi:hypothetical protein
MTQTPEVAMKLSRNDQWAVLCAAALLSTAAIADDTPRKSSATDAFSSLDADGDEKLSKDEAAGNEDLASRFEKLDGNSDGFVSKREFRRHTMPKPKPSY